MIAGSSTQRASIDASTTVKKPLSDSYSPLPSFPANTHQGRREGSQRAPESRFEGGAVGGVGGRAKGALRRCPVLAQ